MNEKNQVLTLAETIAREAKRMETDALVTECEQSDNRTLRSLAAFYRKLSLGFY